MPQTPHYRKLQEDLCGVSCALAGPAGRDIYLLQDPRRSGLPAGLRSLMEFRCLLPSSFGPNGALVCCNDGPFSHNAWLTN